MTATTVSPRGDLLFESESTPTAAMTGEISIVTTGEISIAMTTGEISIAMTNGGILIVLMAVTASATTERETDSTTIETETDFTETASTMTKTALHGARIQTDGPQGSTHRRVAHQFPYDLLLVSQEV